MSNPLQDALTRYKVTQGAATKRQNDFASTPKDKRGEFISGVNAAAGVIPAAEPGLALLPDTIEGRRQGAAAGKSFIDNDGSTWANDGDGGFNVQPSPIFNAPQVDSSQVGNNNFGGFMGQGDTEFLNEMQSVGVPQELQTGFFNAMASGARINPQSGTLSTFGGSRQGQKPDGSALAPSSDYGDDLLADFHKQYPNGVHNADGSVNQPIGIDIASAAPIPIAPDPSAAPVDPNANYGFTPAPAESPELIAAKANAQESIASFTPAPVEAPVAVNGFIADPADRAARGLPLLPADALAPTETPVEPTGPVNPITETGIDRLDLDPSVEGNGIGMVNPETGDPLMSIEGVDSTRNNQALLPAGMAASDPTGSGQFKAIGGDGKMVLVSTQEEADRLNKNEHDVQAADKIAHQKFLASPEAAAMTKRQMQPTAYDIASQERMDALQPMERDGGLSGAARDTVAANGRTDRTAVTEQPAPDGAATGKKSERTIQANAIAQRNGWIQADTPERAEAYIQLEKTNVATAQIEGFDAQIGELNNGYEALRGQARDAVASSFSGMEGDVASRVEESGMPVLQSLQDIVNTSKDADMVAAAKGYIQSIEQQTDATMLSDENQFGAQAAQYQKQIQAYNQYAEKVAMGAGISRTRGGQPTDALTSGTTTDDAAAHDAIAGLAGGAGAKSSSGGGAADTIPDNSNALTPPPVDPNTSRAGRAVTAAGDALGNAAETTARTAAQMAETGMATTLAAANYIFGKGNISWEAAVAQAEVEAQSAAAALTSQYQQRGPVPVPYGR